MVVIAVTFNAQGINVQKIYHEQLNQTSGWNSNKYLRDFDIQPAINALSLKRGKPPTVNEIAEKIMNAYKIQFGPFENFLGDSAAKVGLEGAIKLGIYAVAAIAATAAISGCIDSDATTTHYGDSDTPTHTDASYKDVVKQTDAVVQKTDGAVQSMKAEPTITPENPVDDYGSDNDAYHKILSEFDFGENMPKNLNDFQINFPPEMRSEGFHMYEDVYVGSCGKDKNDLCLAITEVTETFPFEVNLVRTDAGRAQSFIFNIGENKPSKLLEYPKTTNPEDLDGMKGYRTEDGFALVRIPGLAKNMRDAGINYMFFQVYKAHIDPKLL